MVQNLEIPSLKELYSWPYDKNMNEWRRLGARDKARNIVRALAAPGIKFAPSTVLEVGAGTGAILKILSTLITADQLVGLEIDEAASRIEETSNPKCPIKISSYDGQAIPYPDEQFDIVYASHVLEHVTNERGFLHELRRVSKKYILLEVPLRLKIQVQHPPPRGHRMLRWTDDTSTSIARNVA